MSKMKIRKSLTNRLKITKNGKVLRRQSFRRHLKAAKSSKRLHNLKKTVQIFGFYAKRIRRATGNVLKAGSKTK